VKTTHLDLVLHGNGDVVLGDLQAAGLDAGITGSGEVTLGGTVGDATIVSTGNGALLARDLVIDDLVVDLGGSSDSTVTVDDHIAGEVGGSGHLDVFGNPEGTVTESGSGEVDWH
jgi:hypothetical protein